jgi:hypothetical protein
MATPTPTRMHVLIVQNADRGADEPDVLFSNTPAGMSGAEQLAKQRSANGSTQEIVVRWMEETFKVARRFENGSKVPLVDD